MGIHVFRPDYGEAGFTRPCPSLRPGHRWRLPSLVGALGSPGLPPPLGAPRGAGAGGASPTPPPSRILWS